MQVGQLSASLHRWLRRPHRALPAASVLFALSRVAAGGFSELSLASWWEALAIVSLLGAIGVCAMGRLRLPPGACAGLRADLELGGALLAQAYLVVALGGPALFPLILLMLSLLATFIGRAAVLTLLGGALVFESLLTLFGLSPSVTLFLAHSVFLVLFAGLYHAVLAARLALARHAEGAALEKRLAEIEERARTYRLVSSGTQDSAPGLAAQEKWLLASVREVEGAVGAALEIAELALRTHSVGAFLLTSDDRSLKLHDCRSASDRVTRERFAPGEGIVGGVLKRGAPVRMHSPAGLKGVTYYEPGGVTVRAVLVVPILEKGGLLRGVLVADRLEDRPFDETDERLLATVAAEVLRAIEVERVMGYIRKTRDEKDRFFRAIEELNRAGKPEEVFSAVLESARTLAGLDFCAVTLVLEEEGKRRHRIVKLTGVTSVGLGLSGQTFADNNGLVANVVRYGAPLPGRDVKAMDRQVIFDEEVQFRGLAALKIFPLKAGDRILGTLVAGSRKRDILDHDVLRMLEVLAIQAAQAVLRAQLYEDMQRMATTDGLTGLLNHRSFQSRADEALAHARRYGRRCSFVLTDVDHFKNVNDTYGHSIGDQVLKGVARILREQARDTDAVARYGGEEFVLVMPETDTQGARIIAERIRLAIAAEVFQTELGPLSVTLSLGIATFPEHAEAKQALVDLADGCLYFAKEHGRNQSVTVHELRSGKKEPLARAG